MALAGPREGRRLLNYTDRDTPANQGQLCKYLPGGNRGRTLEKLLICSSGRWRPNFQHLKLLPDLTLVNDPSFHSK